MHDALGGLAGFADYVNNLAKNQVDGYTLT